MARRAGEVRFFSSVLAHWTCKSWQTDDNRPTNRQTDDNRLLSAARPFSAQARTPGLRLLGTAGWFFSDILNRTQCQKQSHNICFDKNMSHCWVIYIYQSRFSPFFSILHHFLGAKIPQTGQMLRSRRRLRREQCARQLRIRWEGEQPIFLMLLHGCWYNSIVLFLFWHLFVAGMFALQPGWDVNWPVFFRGNNADAECCCHMLPWPQAVEALAAVRCFYVQLLGSGSRCRTEHPESEEVSHHFSHTNMQIEHFCGKRFCKKSPGSTSLAVAVCPTVVHGKFRRSGPCFTAGSWGGAMFRTSQVLLMFQEMCDFPWGSQPWAFSSYELHDRQYRQISTSSSKTKSEQGHTTQ